MLELRKSPESLQHSLILKGRFPIVLWFPSVFWALKVKLTFFVLPLRSPTASSLLPGMATWASSPTREAVATEGR